MTTYVMRNGQLVEKHLAEPLYTGDEAFHVISDTMEPTRHMATNRIHTSKSAFRADTRASGCVEVGNETSYLTKPRAQIKPDRAKLREDLRRAIYQLRNGQRP